MAAVLTGSDISTLLLALAALAGVSASYRAGLRAPQADEAPSSAFYLLYTVGLVALGASVLAWSVFTFLLAFGGLCAGDDLNVVAHCEEVATGRSALLLVSALALIAAGWAQAHGMRTRSWRELAAAAVVATGSLASMLLGLSL